MSVANKITSIKTHIQNAYGAIEEVGGDLPTQKNLANLATAIDSIVTTPPYDPSNPTLAGLKAALDAGDYTAFPVGTEIPDTYNGQAMKWTVMDYGNATLTDDRVVEGVYLIRFENLGDIIWGDVYYNKFYSQSNVYSHLKNSYPVYCSDELKSLVKEIKVPVSDGEVSVNAEYWVPSATEVYGYVADGGGYPFELWKQRTGLTAPSNSANAGRLLKDGSYGLYYFLRDVNQGAPHYSYCVNQQGAVANHSYGGMRYTPCCFISKN